MGPGRAKANAIIFGRVVGHFKARDGAVHLGNRRRIGIVGVVNQRGEVGAVRHAGSMTLTWAKEKSSVVLRCPVFAQRRDFAFRRIQHKKAVVGV